MRDSLTFRPIVDADLPFLQRLYASTRQEELAPVPWSEAEKEEFLRLQFEAQHRHYLEHFKHASFQIVLLDGEAIGRLYVDRRRDEIRLVDIALLPEHRGAGIGTPLIQQLQAEAEATGRPLRIHVEHNNRALSLYERLGFRQIEDQGVYSLLEWRGEA